MKTIIDKLKKGIMQDGKAVDISLQFQQFSTDEERVILAMEMCSIYKITIPKISNQKSTSESKKWRDKGNDMFVRNNSSEHFTEACKLYSKSVAFAPKNSDELALAYANRSAVLFRLGKYEHCIKDIEKCLSLNYPNHLKLKILLRKIECFVKLNSPKVLTVYEETLEWIEKSQSKEKEKMRQKLELICQHRQEEIKEDEKSLDAIFAEFVYDRPNGEIDACSDALDVRYNDTFGRHVVATRDIRPGEIIAKETPYCLALSVSNKYSHCWQCLEYIWNGISCDHCVHAMFCSGKCKQKAWKDFHEVECNILTRLLGLDGMADMENLGILSLRLAILAVRELNGLENLVDEIADVEQCSDLRVKGFSNDGKFHSNKYRSVYSLATNTEKRPPADLFDRSTYASVLVYLLATETDFFGQKLTDDWDDLRKNKKVTFVGGLILRHQQIIPSNIHSYAEENNLETRERGSAVMPFLSFANHTCDANVTRSCRKGYQILYALYPIKKGEQIFDNYGIHYAVMPKILRQQVLAQQFYFDCNCTACEENWPLYREIQSYKVTIKCNKVKSELDKATRNYTSYISSAMSGTIHDKPMILKNLSSMLQALMKHVKLPCKEVNDVTEMMKRVFDLNGNRFVLPQVVA